MKVGLIVNPIAGIGGRVGLKGSDGEASVKALELGATQLSPLRAVDALHEMLQARDEFDLITYPDEMGANESRAAGFQPRVIGSLASRLTTAGDTRRAARDMQELGVDLILFAGGDGTARDVCEVVDESLPTLGIPTGVKMHSGVFAINPRAAGQLAVSFLRGGAATKSMEVVDFARELPNGNRELKLFGYLKVPYERAVIQGTKTAAPSEDDEEEIAHDVIDDMIEGSDDYIIIGPGKTAKAILQAMGLEYTMLGVDVLHRKKLVYKDANEKQLLDVTSKGRSKIVMSVIGGQGFLFGRGNQQISPEVIRKVGKSGIVIVSTEGKLIGLQGRPILVDTGDEHLDLALTGYYKVVTGYRKRFAYMVARS